MKDQCVDTGTIQAFLDGELATKMSEAVARHVAVCDDCALALSQAEEESVFAFDLMGEEFNSLVPTERIRTNLYQAIALTEKPRVSFWQKVFNFNYLANPSAVAFALLLIVFGTFAAFFSFRKTADPVVATVETKPNPAIENINPIPTNTPVVINDTPQNVAKTTSKTSVPKIERIYYKPEPTANPRGQKVELEIKKSPGEKQKPVTESAKSIPAVDGEETYLKTIATLESTANANKDNVLRASSRVSYERNMAVVDDSIMKMKAEINKNPKNQAAKQILRNSYQTKIEMLSSVAERSELVATRLD